MNTTSASPLRTSSAGVPLLDTFEEAAPPADDVGEGAAGLYVLVAVPPPAEAEVIFDEVLVPVVAAATKPRQVLYE